MIKACSSCPDCLTDTLPFEPQPLYRNSRSGAARSLERFVFQCRCGRKWSGRISETAEHYDFLERANLFNFPPRSPSTSVEPANLMGFVRYRLREVLSRL